MRFYYKCAILCCLSTYRNISIIYNPAAGGMKWDFGQVTIRNAYVHDNDCRGLWADMNAHDAVIEHSLVDIDRP